MRTYALVILVLYSITAISQNCNNNLSGTVKDSHDNSPLVGATLIVAGTEQAVQTDLDGNYTITGLCNQEYSIQISHPECLTKGYTIKVSGATTKNFKLEHHLEELNQITIDGKVYKDKSKTLIQSGLSIEEIEKFSNGSLGDALNSLSGVSSLNTGNTVVKPLINGLHSSRVVIINNGVRMEDQEWGSEHAPNVDINSAGKLTLIKGAGALQYSGDAVGGVIISEAAKVPVKDSLYGKTLFSAASNGRGTTVSSQLTKSYQNGWFGTVQGTLKRFEGYYSIFKNEIGILRASHLGGAQDQINAINSREPSIIRDFTYNIDAPKQDVTHHLARLKAFKRFESIGKLSFQYDFQANHRLEYDIRRGDDKDKASLDLDLKTHTIMLDLESKLSNSLNLKSGILGRYQNNFADPNTGVRRLIPDYDKYEIGAYLIADYDLNDDWLLEIGGRFDYTYMDVFKFYRTSFWESRNYDQLFPEIVVEELGNQILTNPEYNFYNASGTVGTTYSFNEDYKLFFNYSLASRAPNPSELFSEGLHHSASRIELGDLRFNSEIGHKFSLTFQREKNVFSFSINPYINIINDFIVIEPTEIQQTIRGNFQVWEYRQTNAELLGVDIDASYSFAENFRFEHQFSLVKGYDRTNDTPLISIPAVNTKNGIVYQKPELNSLRLSLQSEYVFRQNEFPNTNFEVFIPETQTTEIVDVSTPPEAYHLLDFDSSIDFKLNNKSTLTVGLGIKNLFNTSYRNYLNRLRYYADDLGRNFLLNLKIDY